MTDSLRSGSTRSSDLALIRLMPPRLAISGVQRQAFSIGAPFPRGRVPESLACACRRADGSVAPVQSAVLDRWPDGSVRWMQVDFQTEVRSEAAVTIVAAAVPGSDVPLASHVNGRVIVRTGVAEFTLGPSGLPFERVSIAGREALDPAASGFEVTGRSGATFQLQDLTFAVEENGPLRAAVRAEGWVRVDLRSRLHVVARLHFFAGMPIVKCELTIRNPQRARHRGGFWELGDPGSILIRDASLRITLPAGGTSAEAYCSESPGVPLRRHAPPFALYQDSSGGERWQSPVHRNRDGKVPLSFRGYRLETGTARESGLRATPLAQLAEGRCAVGIAMEHFWENFPKAITAQDRAIGLHLFPGQHADVHEIQGGEQKTHVFWLSFGDPASAGASLEWCRNPWRAVVDPEWACATEAVPFLTPGAADPNAAYLDLVDTAIAGSDSFFTKRDAIDEYGWRHFGDVWADHEAVFEQGPQPFVSHYNNQYDAVAGCAYQLLRSGDARWWTLMDDLARHVADVDIYHTDRDWPKYNHGLFWHTFHYQDAGLSTHRSYPRLGKVNGGGPSAGHLYTTGLLLHYLLTGSRMSREAVIELATFVIDADAGGKSVFGWLDTGPTGYASESGRADYHGPGRAPANAVNALLDAHRLTGEARFLAKAEELIRRCTHPDDDIEARRLLDAERRWFYTMFLQSLGKYLQYKEELDEIDHMYAYARASLLAYARWMAVHEYPYLEKPEILEYPTETWAAQDMRKSEVFKWAALNAVTPERERFLERSRFFFDASVTTLAAAPTRTLARPVILLLSYGWWQATISRGLSLPPPCATEPQDFGEPARFEPQKPRAIRKAAVVAGVAAIVTAGALALAAMLWVS